MSPLAIYIFFALLFFMWNSKNKKKKAAEQQQMLDSIRPGAYVLVNDGMYGTVVDVEGEDVVINFSIDGADEGCLRISRSTVHSIVEESDSAIPEDSIQAKLSYAEQIEDDADEVEAEEAAEAEEEDEV